MPSHIGFTGQADGWDSSQTTFTLDLAAGIFSAAIITFLIAMVGSDLSRFGGSTLLASISLVMGIYSFTWFWSVSTADQQGQRATSYGETALWGLAVAGAIFTLGALPRPHRATKTSTDDADPDS